MNTDASNILFNTNLELQDQFLQEKANELPNSGFQLATSGIFNIDTCY